MRIDARNPSAPTLPLPFRVISLVSDGSHLA